MKECYRLTLLFMILYLGSGASAQDPCKPGERARGDKCEPISPRTAKPPQPPKTCSINVQLSKDSSIKEDVKGVTLGLRVTNPSCTKKIGKKAIYDYSPTPKTARTGEQVTFSKLDCSCNYELATDVAEHQVKEGKNQTLANIRTNNRPTVTLIPNPAMPKPTPKPAPCSNVIAPEPIFLDAEAKAYELNAQSNCNDLVQGKQYYKDHLLSPDVTGYTIAVRLESGFDLKLLQGSTEISCKTTPSADSTSQIWECALPSDQQCQFRVISKKIGIASNLSYQLGVQSVELNEQGYGEWLTKNVLAKLGNMPGPNQSAIVNSLSHQIDISNTEKLDVTTESLEKLERLTQRVTYNKSLAASLLGMIYRYHKKDSTKAKKKENEAIEQGAFARFRVMIGKEKDARKFPKFWLLIGKREMRLEPFEQSTNEKLLPKINLAKNPVAINQKFTTSSAGNLPVQCVKVTIEKPDYYILPLSYDRDEANAIADFIKNMLNAR